MSVVGRDQRKVVLTRAGADEFWMAMQRHYAEDDVRKWKGLAMLALREDADWPLELIGLVFGRCKGSVGRAVERTKADLRERFRAERGREERGGGAEGGRWKVDDGEEADAA